jgi:hypothetical protein
MAEKLNKETVLNYFHHLKNCIGYGAEECKMKETLDNDDNFRLIESEFKEAIEEIKKQLPDKRLKNLESKLKNSFDEDNDDDDDEDERNEEEVLGYDNYVNKLINEREYDDCDYDNMIFEQRMSFDDRADEFVGNPKKVTLDSVLEKMQEIKTKYPGQKIYINTFGDGTMALDRIRVYAITKKLRPLYEVYSRIYNVVKYDLQQHEYEVAAFKRQQKELGL